MEPWSIPEAAEALRRLAASDDRANLVMNAYLILGLERPAQGGGAGGAPVRPQGHHDLRLRHGQPTVSEYIEVCRAYTDEDGVKETKNAHSVRTVPVLLAGRERLHQIMDELRPSITVEGGTSVTEQVREWSGQRIVNMRGDNLVRAWRRMCVRHDLRYIPPKALRHTSETIMAATEVDPLSIMDLHGHTDLGTDYRHYIKPGLAERREGRQAGRARPADRRGRRRGRRF